MYTAIALAMNGTGGTYIDAKLWKGSIHGLPRQVKSNDHPKFLPPTIQPKPNNVSAITPPQSPAFFSLSFPLALYLLPLDERVELVDVDGAFELLELCGMVVVLDGLRRLVGSVG